MLTLREPIKLNNRTVTSIGTSFGDRIRDNYNQLNVSLSPEDLLHIVSMPAEVFYSEGNQTSIFNRNIKIENVNEQKIDIVNKLINRILISGQNNFTYQDRTYISNYLNKLGIRDEKRFMSRITEMMSERTSQTKELKELTSRVDTLREKIPEVMESIKQRNDQVGSKDNGERSNLYLAENIYNRLMTDRIYDTVWNFNHVSHEENNITNKELNISEQKRSSSFIKLNNLAQNIVGAPVNIVHYRGNVFEDNSILDEILNLSENLKIEGDRITPSNSTNNEYSLDNTNTYVNQYNANTIEQLQFTHTDKNINQTLINNEISLINEDLVRNQLVESAFFNLIEQVYESRLSLIDNGINTEINIGNAMFETASNTFSRYVENIVAPVVNKTIQADALEPAVRDVLSYLENTTVEETKEEHILKEIKQIDRQNIENENHYLRVMQQLSERITKERPQALGSVQERMRESLDALDNPAQFILKYREEKKADREKEDKDKDMYLEAYPEKVRPFLKYIDGIMKNKAQGEFGPADPMDALSILNADIADVEMSHRKEAEIPSIAEPDKGRQVLVETVVNQIKGSPKGLAVSENINHISQINRDINLVHKTVETINESEILERIDELRNEQRENRTVTQTVTDDVVTHVNKVNHEERVVTESINQTEIADIVRQNIISQMGDLSEQVYSRIERRLQNEKIRRGF